jgi:protein SCO1
MLNRRQILLVSASIALMAAGAAIGVITARYYQTPSGSTIEGLLWPNPKQIGPFQAIDQSGTSFDALRLHGKWSMLYFGYTNCPDICPVTLAVLHQVRNLLARQGEDTPQVLFVTVDPKRDGAARLREYLAYFDAEFIGVGGSTAQVQSLGAQFGVAPVAVDAQEGTDYGVEHPSSVFLTDLQARLVGIFSAPLEAAEVASRYLRMRAYIESQERS